jgi:SAM-dependent methyltransferase
MDKIDLLKDGNGSYARDLDFSSTWSVAHFIRFLSFAQRIISHGAESILDVGFGDNALVKFLERLGYTGSYCGIDINETYVAAAQASTHPFPTKYEFKNIYSVDGQFDVVVLGEVIEHVPKAEGGKFLAKAKSLLSKNGIILLSTPNKQGGQLVWPRDHEDEYEYLELKALCAKEGLIVDHEYGLWNNTANTVAMLSRSQVYDCDDDGSSDSELAAYNRLCGMLPKSIINVVFNMVHTKKSRLIVLVLKNRS